MDILSVLGQVRSLLRQEGRLSYRILKRQFALDDEALDDLKYELIEVQEIAIDKDGKMLVWTGSSAKEEPENRRIGETETRKTTSSDSRLQTLDPLATRLHI